MATEYAQDYPDAGYAGYEWVEAAQKYWVTKRGKQYPGAAPMSDFGRRVADILGDCFAGIYHLDHGALSRVEWCDERYIEFVHYGEIASYDFGEMTRLVFLAHQRNVRIAVQGCGPRLMRFIFHALPPRGNGKRSHPTIEDYAEMFDKAYGIKKPAPAGGEARQ